MGMDGVAEPAAPEIGRRLEENLALVRSEIEAACARGGRPAGSVKLLGVVKYTGAAVSKLLAERGLLDLAEGTVQGAIEKERALRGLQGLRWHLVGHLQRNKVRKALQLFESIHSLDSLRLARKIELEIAEAEAASGPSPAGDAGPALPRLYLEVNIADERAKGGIGPEEAIPFLEELRGLPRVGRRLEGLMTMAPHLDNPQSARPHFRNLRELRDRLAALGFLPAGAGLSMGMSGDFAVAVEEGATVVRVGTRLLEGLPLNLDPGAAGRPEAPRCP
jgi:pyridoxal phosphate enzyme (YggS family)